MRRVGAGLVFFTSLFFSIPAQAAETTPAQGTTKPGEGPFDGLKLRHLGPAFTSGRISDIAVDPHDRSTWYVAAGSGGVWKTTNAGTSFEPVFDGEASYSIGCVAVDPRETDVVWVGTGENVSGRHVGFGDGVYKSRDGGRTWTNVGLHRSEHVSKILIDPRDTDVVYVAAEGPLWSAGGERGVFKSSDGGTTWTLALDLGPDTGATDLEFDPGDPDTVYAAAYQRRRTVWSLLNGSGSGIYQSTDAGATWRRLKTGLPEGDAGKIGLAVTPADPAVVYATIEASDEDKGVYRSADRGESWEKRSDVTASSYGTGPHYYQEIEASPHDADLVYQMDVRIQVSHDGGKTFARLGEPDKHSDNHALYVDPADPEHLIAGSDGGVYETFDHAKTWRYVANLPLTQFYKIALDEAVPFYNVLAGAQDNGTQLGPSRTRTRHGIRNSDWVEAYGADGYACQVDPSDPNTLYVEWQEGHPLRVDARTLEAVDIQPQPEPGAPAERYNWDAPILISPHASSRIYYGSQRLWRSDDRGESWQPLSPDLTRGQHRYEMPVGGRVPSVDALFGNTAMSWYGTLSAIAESPRVEGLLYTGSDDGLIQVSEDGGATWRRSERPAGVASLAFVNEIKASVHDADTVFAAIDDHKEGDYAPYLLMSTDRGRTWHSISGDLPARHLVWSVAEDHVDPDLLFAGTEFGLFFTLDRGTHWTKLAGAPTIPFRDIDIQRRESDLVGGSFGRGVWVLDDYSPLRGLKPADLQREAALFPVSRTAYLYEPSSPLGGGGRADQGAGFFVAPNPPFGAVFTYYLRDEIRTARSTRRETEKPLEAAGKDVPFPGWDTIRDEDREPDPAVVLSVRDASGELVRRITGPVEAGFHRVAWDLHYPPVSPTELDDEEQRESWEMPPRGPWAPPGRYTVELATLVDGKLAARGEAQEFEVAPLPGGTETDVDWAGIDAFQRGTAELRRRAEAAAARLEEAEKRLEYMGRALLSARGAGPELFARVQALTDTLADLRVRLVGDRVLSRFEEPRVPSVLSRIATVWNGHWDTTHGPTLTHRRSIEIATSGFAEVSAALREAVETKLPELEKDLEAAGAPWTPGRALP